MKYSVIIPVYNAAATISRCLDSLLGQPHEDVRILLINDGSTDESGTLCRRYAQAHPCVSYFEKENGGVSSARNLGLEKADGEYILFVDSDDYVSADYFAVIREATQRLSPDLLLFGLKCFGTGDDVWKTGSFCGNDPLEISRFVLDAVYGYLYSNLMTRCFRREIIRAQGLRFDEALWIGEDQAFVFAYTMHVKRMVSLDKVLYHYARENANSLTLRNRENLSGQLLRVIALMQAALDSADCSRQVRQVYQEAIAWSHYRSIYSACKELRKFDLSAPERRARIRQICTDYCRAGIAPTGLHPRLIAIPVKCRMSRVIDTLSVHSESCKKLVR